MADEKQETAKPTEVIGEHKTARSFSRKSDAPSTC
jgi:hypothetical protein